MDSSTILPLQSTSYNRVEAPYTNRGGIVIASDVGFGATSRVTGKCMARHMSHNGTCWGGFHNERTKFVDDKDHDISALTEENIVKQLRAGNLAGNTNVLGNYASVGITDPASQRANGPWIPNVSPNVAMSIGLDPTGSSCTSVPPKSYGMTGGSIYNMTQVGGNADIGPTHPSYGSYSSCPNCSMGYGNYSGLRGTFAQQNVYNSQQCTNGYGVANMNYGAWPDRGNTCYSKM